VENAIALLVLVSVVLGQRWVWVIAFFIAGAASLFATFASIIAFSTEIPIVRNGLRLRAEVLEQARDTLDGL
jgi:hypothetical protein